MTENCRASQLKIPVSEIKLQLNYARTVGNDIFNAFADTTPNPARLMLEYNTIQTKLSMLLDFLFQAELWCKITENNTEEKCEQ